MSVDVVTFGCRLNAYESEVIRREAAAAGVADAVVVNTCAVTGRGGAAGAPGHPQAQARAAGRAHRGHRLRGADRARRPSPTCPRSTACSATRRSSAPRSGASTATRLGAPFGLAAEEKIVVNDIMAVTETARAPDRRPRGPRARLRAGAERLRPPLHLLHHPLRARQFALGADGRGGGRRCAASCERGYREVVLTGVDHHQLRRRTCRARRSSARW